jgi:hypothetical protein
MRERLPEFLHGALPSASRDQLAAHLATCDACRAELEVLRTAQAVLGSARVALDTAAIVRALPPPGAARPPSRVPGLWRIAAAIAVVASGAVALALLVNDETSVPSVAQVPAIDSAPLTVTPPLPQPSQPEPPRVLAQDSPRARPQGQDLTVTDDMSDLADDELEALIEALDRLEASPRLEPDVPPARRVIGDVSGATRE